MNKSQENSKIDNVRHSLAHLLAMAVLKKFPKAQLGVGPVVEYGFYYDIKLPRPLSDGELAEFEKTMRGLIYQNLAFKGEKITPQKARSLFKLQLFKLDLIREFSKEKKELTAYHTGEFTDLCRGGHVKNTSEINPEAFKLTNVAGAYWRGDEKNAQLTRIYGIAFATKEELAAHLAFLEEAKRKDHKRLGVELDLFTFSDAVGKGLPLWTPKGSIIRRQLERFIVDEEIKRGYLHVYTPDIAKLDLYIKSGHYPHYKDSMYAPIDIDGEKFMLRPMTCPHHFELYLRTKHSYRELPMRIAELAQLYRYEQSGELSGLQRVRTFCLADAHIICASEEQAMEEISGALDLIEHIAHVLGLMQGKEYWYRLSLGDRKNKEKYFKNDAAWNKGEIMLRQLLTKRKCAFIEAPDEAAFYGPKIDIQMRNANGKEDTAFTVQYDFCMPDRFNLSYVDKDGSEKHTFVVHRSSIGAIERIVAFLIEHYAGAFPLWLAPVQVAVLTVMDVAKDYAHDVVRALEEQNMRVNIDDRNETIGKKIREHEMQKIPYLLVIGGREAESKTVAVRERSKGNLGAMSLEDFLKRLEN